MSAILVETPPVVEPVSLAEVKIRLGIGPLQDSDHVLSAIETANLRGLITAAREFCENFTRRSFITKGYVQYLDSFPYYTDTIMSQQAYPPAYYSLPRYSTTLWNYSQMIKLYFSPLISVDNITYFDSGTGRPKALVLGRAPWFPLAKYSVGSTISDSDGNIRAVTAISTGITGQVEPSWGSGTVTDAGVTWGVSGGVAPVSDYVIDVANEPPRIFPLAGQNWPSCLYVPNAVQIHFTAGYGNTPSAVPGVVRVAMQMLIKYWYKDGGTVGSAPEGVKGLLWSLRVADQSPSRG